jgi:copper(I)-binding protein
VKLRRWWLLVLVAVCSGALAQVEVQGAWARATVPGQTAGGAFMTLTAKEGARLVGATSPAAGVVEVHEMAMDGNVMKMRAIPALELPAGRAVELKPGGYHVMLLDLKRPLAVGQKISLDLRLELPDRRQVTQTVSVEVRTTAPISGSQNDAHKKH